MLPAIVGSLAIGVGIGLLTAVSMTLPVGSSGRLRVGVVRGVLFVHGPVNGVEVLTAQVQPKKVPGGDALGQFAD